MSIEHCSINLLEYDLYCKTFWRSGMGNRLWGEQQKLGMNLNPWISRGLVKNRTFFLEKGKVFFWSSYQVDKSQGQSKAPPRHLVPIYSHRNNLQATVCEWPARYVDLSHRLPSLFHPHLTNISSTSSCTKCTCISSRGVSVRPRLPCLSPCLLWVGILPGCLLQATSNNFHYSRGISSTNSGTNLRRPPCRNI